MLLWLYLGRVVVSVDAAVVVECIGVCWKGGYFSTSLIVIALLWQIGVVSFAPCVVMGVGRCKWCCCLCCGFL